MVSMGGVRTQADAVPSAVASVAKFGCRLQKEAGLQLVLALGPTVAVALICYARKERGECCDCMLRCQEVEREDEIALETNNNMTLDEVHGT